MPSACAAWRSEPVFWTLSNSSIFPGPIEQASEKSTRKRTMCFMEWKHTAMAAVGNGCVCVIRIFEPILRRDSIRTLTRFKRMTLRAFLTGLLLTIYGLGLQGTVALAADTPQSILVF